MVVYPTVLTIVVVENIVSVDTIGTDITVTETHDPSEHSSRVDVLVEVPTVVGMYWVTVCVKVVMRELVAMGVSEAWTCTVKNIVQSRASKEQGTIGVCAISYDWEPSELLQCRRENTSSNRLQGLQGELPGQPEKGCMRMGNICQDH